MFKTSRSQAGFTLVELAVVMIIIGLLIGGVLKGQELINNAQLTSTVSQVKAFDAATSSFRDMYDGVPGDILNPGNRLPNCTAAPCNDPGDGDNALDSDLSGVPAAGSESEAFFSQLAAADLLAGIDPTATAGQWGTLYPEANINGGFLVGGSTGVNGNFSGIIVGASAPRSGIYLGLTQSPTAIAEALNPNQAFRIDNKIDDGAPASGSVRAFSGGGCDDGAGAYDEDSPTLACGLYLRIQG